MEDIKVGEYVRTKNGSIDKVINNEYYMAQYIECEHVLIAKDNIVKHSKNIIDLIEIGDYVNSHLVVMKNNDKVATEIGGINGAILHWYKEKGIKSIVIKEQFKKVSYEVEQ